MAHVVFRVTSECWGGISLKLADAKGVSTGTNVINLLLPWHTMFTGTPCPEYTLIAERVGTLDSFQVDGVEISSVECGGALVLAPMDGDSISPDDSAFTFVWNSSELFYFSAEGPLGTGKVTEVSRVTLSLLGKVTPSNECFGHQDGADCMESVMITPPEGVENTGSFNFNFSSKLDGQGNLLPWEGGWSDRYSHIKLKITAYEHTLTAGYSSGWFFIGSGGLPYCTVAKDLPNEANLKQLAILDTAHSKENVAADGDVILRRLSSASIEGSSKLLSSINFEKFVVSALGAVEFTAYEDSTEEADVAAVLVESTVFYSGSLDDLPSVPAAAPTTTPTTTAKDASKDDDDNGGVVGAAVGGGLGGLVVLLLLLVGGEIAWQAKKKRAADLELQKEPFSETFKREALLQLSFCKEKVILFMKKPDKEGSEGEKEGCANGTIKTQFTMASLTLPSFKVPSFKKKAGDDADGSTSVEIANVPASKSAVPVEEGATFSTQFETFFTDAGMQIHVSKLRELGIRDMTALCDKSVLTDEVLYDGLNLSKFKARMLRDRIAKLGTTL